MNERIEQFLASWVNPESRDIGELKALYKIATGKAASKCEKPVCISRMLNEVRKYQHSINKLAEDIKGPERKYILKPGVHSLGPGEAPIHSNENTTDELIEWYLNKYPHVSKLLIN